jgi:hypothetical protein
MFKIDFVVRGNGSGKDLEVDCSSLDSVQYAFEGKLPLITSN